MTRVYAAEDAAFGKRGLSNKDRTIAVPDAQVLVDRYVDGWTVGRGSGFGSWCYPTRQQIMLGRYATLPIVLHETAHALTDGRSHGELFQAEYLRLVEAEMGRWWAGRLARALDRAKPRGASSAVRAWRRQSRTTESEEEA